jgi:hypothetical protein
MERLHPIDGLFGDLPFAMQLQLVGNLVEVFALDRAVANRKPDACRSELTPARRAAFVCASYALNRIFERDAFRVVLREPSLRSRISIVVILSRYLFPSSSELDHNGRPWSGPRMDCGGIQPCPNHPRSSA